MHWLLFFNVVCNQPKDLIIIKSSFFIKPAKVLKNCLIILYKNWKSCDIKWKLSNLLFQSACQSVMICNGVVLKYATHVKQCHFFHLLSLYWSFYIKTDKICSYLEKIWIIAFSLLNYFYLLCNTSGIIILFDSLKYCDNLYI